MCYNLTHIFYFMFVLQNYDGLLYVIYNYLRFSFIFILFIIENGISYKLMCV